MRRGCVFEVDRHAVYCVLLFRVCGLSLTQAVRASVRGGGILTTLSVLICRHDPEWQWPFWLKHLSTPLIQTSTHASRNMTAMGMMEGIGKFDSHDTTNMVAEPVPPTDPRDDAVEDGVIFEGSVPEERTLL